MTTSVARRVLTGVLVCLLPCLAGLYAGATTFGGRVVPWRPVMVDLDVYRLAGRVALEGGDFYHLPESLPFLYPPFAALLAIPLVPLPVALVQIGWTIASVLALLAVLHRLGLSGWKLSLVGTAMVLFMEPVYGTLSFGQVGIFLMALCYLDLAPGPRVFGRRLLPEGVLIGIATAVKLTPGIFLLYLLATRRWRAAATCVITMAVTTLLAAIFLPSQSWGFWSRLATGDTGLGDSIVYYTNQSVMADWLRLFGVGSTAKATALLACAAVAAIGVWAAARMEKISTEAALVLTGVAGLLASPVSWSHHFVWIAPMALVWLRPLLGRQPLGPRQLKWPAWYTALGWVFIIWVAVARFKTLPNGNNVELSYSWEQSLLACTTALLGVVVLVGALVVKPKCPAPRPRPTTATPATPAKE